MTRHTLWSILRVLPVMPTVWILRAHRSLELGTIARHASIDPDATGDVMCIRCQEAWPCDPLITAHDEQRRLLQEEKQLLDPA